jgi:hypothetical protein
MPPLKFQDNVISDLKQLFDIDIDNVNISIQNQLNHLVNATLNRRGGVIVRMSPASNFEFSPHFQYQITIVNIMEFHAFKSLISGIYQ